MKVSYFDRAALEQRLKMADVLDVVEGVYKSKAEGKTVVWPTVTHNFEDRGAVMDIRSGYDRGSEVYGAKLLATFPENEKRGLPPFSGILVAMDGTTGLPKGIMDASFITSMRTGAAAAVSARALARPESDTLLVLGTGRQSLFMIGAALTAMKNIKTVYCAEPMNLDAAKPYAAACPQRMQEMFGLDASDVQFIPVSDLAESVGKADIIITITRRDKADHLARLGQARYAPQLHWCGHARQGRGRSRDPARCGRLCRRCRPVRERGRMRACRQGRLHDARAHLRPDR